MSLEDLIPRLAMLRRGRDVDLCNVRQSCGRGQLAVDFGQGQERCSAGVPCSLISDQTEENVQAGLAHLERCCTTYNDKCTLKRK